MLSRYQVLAALILLPTLGASDARSSPILDASFEPPGTAAFTGVISSRFDGSFIDQAQSFIVGTSGLLTTVDVLLQRTQAAADLLVDIRSIVAGFPTDSDASALASAVVPLLTVPDTSFPQWVSVDLDIPLAVTVGDQLALVLRTRSVFPFDQEYLWRGDTEDQYLGGAAFFRSSADGGQWVQMCAFGDCSEASNRVDWGFRTFVTASEVPEPSIILLLGAGVATAAWRRNHRVRIGRWNRHRNGGNDPNTFDAVASTGGA